MMTLLLYMAIALLVVAVSLAILNVKVKEGKAGTALFYLTLLFSFGVSMLAALSEPTNMLGAKFAYGIYGILAVLIPLVFKSRSMDKAKVQASLMAVGAVLLLFFL